MTTETKIDFLTEMMRMQEVLNTNVIDKLGLLHYNPDKAKAEAIPFHKLSDQSLLIEHNKRAWADRFASALTAEVCETREALTQDVKWWKDKRKDDNGVKEEMIDQLHFLMSQFLSMGMTAQEVFDIYCEKNKANFERKDWSVNQ